MLYPDDHASLTRANWFSMTSVGPNDGFQLDYGYQAGRNLISK